MQNADLNEKIAVVYLFWMPYGDAHLKSFISSYLRHPAGCEHTLYILFNGAVNEAEIAGCKSWLNESVIEYKALEIAGGQDITAYFYAANVLSESLVLFLNTYSRFRQPGWLSLYQRTFAIHQKSALVGATASWQSYVSTVFQTHPLYWEGNKGWSYNYRKYKLFAKALLYWSWLFSYFPNRHIRSNAFMVRREVFIRLFHGPLRTKLQAYQFESGRRGMTRQVQKMGYDVFVIDKLGNQFTLQECKDVDMFWTRQQVNLLITDNQTDKYDDAGESEKKKFYHLAWGR